MGFFDFLKGKKVKEIELPRTEQNLSSSVINNDKLSNNINIEKINSENLRNDTFELIKMYSEYVVRYINMQIQNNYAPIAAYEKNNGEIIGYLFIGKDKSYSKSANAIILDMEHEFEKRMLAQDINSYVIFYHSVFDDDNNHTVATNSSEFSSISIKYKSKNNLSGTIGLPYVFEDGTIKYRVFSNFTYEQNASILNTQLVSNKDYFQEKIIVEPQITENNIGIKIKKVNNGTIGDMWGGYFGFDTVNSDLIINHLALCLFQEPKRSNDKVLVSEFIFDDEAIFLRGIKTNFNDTRTAFPVVKTNISIEVENTQIYEWENVDNIEGVISGNGKDTFGLTYFATDYAINREKYHNIKKHEIELSGIIYNLEISNIDSLENFSEEFVMYMNNKEIEEIGCFNFIGKLLDYREIITSDDRRKGYLLKIKLINKESDPNFFAIEMLVNKQNMNFEKLEIGMKLSGLFQMQGQIKE